MADLWVTRFATELDFGHEVLLEDAIKDTDSALDINIRVIRQDDFKEKKRSLFFKLVGPWSILSFLPFLASACLHRYASYASYNYFLILLHENTLSTLTRLHDFSTTSLNLTLASTSSSVYGTVLRGIIECIAACCRLTLLFLLVLHYTCVCDLLEERTINSGRGYLILPYISLMCRYLYTYLFFIFKWSNHFINLHLPNLNCDKLNINYIKISSLKNKPEN